MAEIGTGKAIDKSISLPLCLHLRNKFVSAMDAPSSQSCKGVETVAYISPLKIEAGTESGSCGPPITPLPYK